MYQNDYKGFSDSAKQVLSDIGLKIGSHTRVVHYEEFTGQEYKDALKEVHDNMQNFAVKIEQSGVFDDLTNDQKIRFNSAVGNLKLDGSEATVDLLKQAAPTSSAPVRKTGSLELGGSQTFRLDKMTEMVNKTVEHNKEKQIEAQPGGPQVSA